MSVCWPPTESVNREMFHQQPESLRRDEVGFGAPGGEGGKVLTEIGVLKLFFFHKLHHAFGRAAKMYAGKRTGPVDRSLLMFP